ncbi:hypothetical protein ALQ61_200082 [Pseudomonas coronafaciens pv. zizaniae]|nr:hypothetical protein ALQ61_200082 [Pseudomonas coronafaciens pv. zizaniae]
MGAQCVGLSTDDLIDKFSGKSFWVKHAEYMDVYPDECAAIYMRTAQDYFSHLVGEWESRYTGRSMITSGCSMRFLGERLELITTMKIYHLTLNMLLSALNRLTNVSPFGGTVCRGIRGD